MTSSSTDALARAVDRFARRPGRVIGLCLVATIVTGIVDHVTGSQIGLGPLYVIPVAVGSWYLGWAMGSVIAVFAVVVGFLADLTTANSPPVGILAWNSGARALTLLFIVYVVGRMHAAVLELKGAAEHEHDVAERLRAADELKNTFLNAVSHELRTPVTAILGSARTLEDLDGSLPADERRQLIGAVSRNASKLDRMVRDLLDVDRVSRDAAALDRSDVDLSEIVKDVLAGVEVPAEHQLRVASEPLPAFVDAAKVERIVENLVINAVKHCPPDAAIWIAVSREDGVPRLVVEDSGPGVEPAEREAIFEPFRRGDAADGVPGVGIGLSLVRAFAEMHGGTAWVEERVGGGARFVVTLPEPSGSWPRPVRGSSAQRPAEPERAGGDGRGGMSPAAAAAGG